MTETTGANLARYGFRDPARAARELPEGWHADPRWRALLGTLRDVADPDGALRRLRHLDADVLAAALSAPDAARPLLAVIGFSEYLADVIRRVPGAGLELLGVGTARPVDLRDSKEVAIVRIAADDLTTPPGRASFERTGRALADLADRCVASALADVDPPASVAVVAMGKYGGRELNYASDIDVLFVGERADADVQGAVRALMQTMNGPPTVFRTDADLRPEGRDGPLVRTLEAYDAYYRRWAEVWEFQALIKSRFAVGDPSLGARFADLVRPYVWPERLAPDAIEQVRALKARAELEVTRRGLDGRQIKLGPGGIRDVEFAVQLLQLVHGRHRPDLRSPTTLDALDHLGAEGFVGEEDAAALADAYVFLRHTEHRLQLVLGRQTHTLPTAAASREHLARGLGFRDEPGRSALDAFEERWREVTAVVRHLHERLFYRPLLEAFASVPAIGPTLSEDEARERLAALGFDRPPVAQGSIGALTAGASRRAKVMRAILPGMLGWLAEAPDPDAGVRRLAELSETLEGLPHLLALLRDAPPVAELVCRALGTGPVLADLFARDPSLIASLDPDRQAPGREALVREAGAIVHRARDADEAVGALRRFKDTHWVQLAALDLAAGDDPYAFVRTSRELADVGDACLQAALDLARAQQDEVTGGPPPGGSAIVGLGRLGGRELSHASDLDVVFVYGSDGRCPDGTEARLYHDAVGERVVSMLGRTPPIFKVDTELRPEGRDGPLVRSLEGYLQYYERWAELWEFQALLRARHAAGDASLTERLLGAVADRVWPRQLSDEQVRRIRHMKARIERERVKTGPDRRLNVKLGVGGLADVEFTVQLLQMRHGHATASVRTPNTLEAIEALHGAGIVGVRDAAWLRDAYLLLNRIRNHMFLLRGLPTDAVPTRDEEVERLARSLGYGRRSRGRFLEHYRRTTRRARQVCDRLFYGEE